MNMFRKISLLLKYRRTVRAAIGRQIHLLEGDGVSDALGSLTKEETDGLVKWVGDVPCDGTIVEFGTLFGLTTMELARHAPNGAKVVTVDNFCWNPFGLTPQQHEAFTRRILKPWIDDGKVELVVSGSQEFRKSYSSSLPSMVFLDTDHSYEAVRDEIAWAKQAGVKMICGHDYGNPLFGVTRAVDEAFPQGVETAGMCWRAKGN